MNLTAMQITKLIKIKLDNKKEEWERMVATPSLEKMDSSFQAVLSRIDAEYWMLKNLYDEIEGLAFMENEGDTKA